MNPSTIGVDVSKDGLDAYRLADGASRRFANDKTGHKALIKWLSAMPVKLIVFEPTGPYHRALERALDMAGLPIAKVNPRQARHFAEATGKLVKTDRADAAMLARMGEVLKLEARPCISQNMADLKELNLARHALVKDRTAARNRAKTLSIALLKRQNAERLAAIDKKIVEIEAAIEQIIAADAELTRRIRHPAFHPRRLRHHRLRLADRNAGVGDLRRQAGRQPRRLGAHREAIRNMERTCLHPRRQGLSPPSPLYAGSRSMQIQSRSQSHLWTTRQSWKARKGRNHSRHAKAHRPR